MKQKRRAGRAALAARARPIRVVARRRVARRGGWSPAGGGSTLVPVADGPAPTRSGPPGGSVDWATVDPGQRVRTALALGRPDRPPAAWWAHTYREEWSAGDLAAVTIDRHRRFGWDFVKLQPRACCFAQAFGARYERSPARTTAPRPVASLVEGPGDWSRVPAADASVPALADQVEALRRVVEALGPDVPVIQTVFSPLTVAGYLVGEDKSRTASELRSDAGGMQEALARIAETLADFVERSVGAGAAGIFYAISGYASADLLSREEYERLALPHDRRVLEAVPASAWFTVLHLCGPRLHFDLGAELRSAAVSWSIHGPGNPSLAQGRARLGRAVMGGIDHRGMPEASAEDVLGQGRAAVHDTAGEGLLLTPGCSVPPEAPEANLRAVMESAEV